MSKTDSKLNECRKCSTNVRHGGIFCKGVCQAWIHLRCINLSYSAVKTLTHKELEVWKCDDCLGKTGIKTLNLDSENVNSELEYSLSLENEIENAILHENEDLKQELHDLKNRKSTYLLELEHTIREKEEEIEQLMANYDKKENEMLSTIKLLETRLKNENYKMQTLILQAEQDKENLIKELDKHKTWCKSCQIYKNEIGNMMDSIRSLEAASEVLQKDNELLQDWSCVNVEIRKTNEELKRLSEQLGNVSLVQASKADRSLHTRHGMHLSLRGKQWLTSKILEAAVVMTTEQPPPPGCQEEQSTSVEIIPGSQQASPSTKSWSGNSPLKVQHPVT
ncbi:hypothetical protein J6590_045866 [Homalodisca vitripennis]|nr:hypothetical protein J6590_045866 [Homalodisca vitripennis]